MLQEAIASIVKLAKAADDAHIQKVPGLPRKLLLTHCGSREFIDCPAPPRSHFVETLGSFYDAVLAFGAERVSEVYHSESGIVCALDGEVAEHFVKMPLHQSEVLTTIRGLSDGRAFEQRHLVRFLRFELANTGPATELLLEAVRKVDFTRRSDGSSHVEHGRESLGKSVEASVTGALEIPEAIRVNCWIYQVGVRFDQELTIGIHVDPAEARFYLQVLPDEIDRAVESSQLRLGEILKKELGKFCAGVFYGIHRLPRMEVSSG